MVRVNTALQYDTDAYSVRISDWVEDPRGLTVLGTVPVPLRQRMRDSFADVLDANPKVDERKCCFLMGQGGMSPLMRLRYIRRFEDYPNLLFSAEYNNIFNRPFYDRHVATGKFVGLQPEGCDPIFADAGLIDPKGAFGVYAIAPYVLLVDTIRLGNRPMPRSWADLMSNTYRGEVVLSGWRRPGEDVYRAYNKFLLACFARLFGFDGLSQIIANVPELMHTAQMPRFAGSNASVGSIYVLPWAQADLCPRRNTTSIVWPSEGALAYPLWLTMKASHRPDMEPLAAHLFDAETAAYVDINRYPSLALGHNCLPPGTNLYWPGWDFIRHRSTTDFMKKACALFEDALRSRTLSCV